MGNSTPTPPQQPRDSGGQTTEGGRGGNEIIPLAAAAFLGALAGALVGSAIS